MTIDEVTSILESYEELGIKSREYYFLRDMEYSLKKERNISEGQRAWLEKILEKGIPSPVDKSSVSRIESLLDLPAISNSRKNVLYSLRRQAYSGKPLTEKQLLLVDQIENQISSACGLKKSPELIREMRLMLQLSKSRKPAYWRLRPEKLTALSEVCDWIDWHDKKTDGKEPVLNEDSIKILRKIFRRSLNQLENSPHEVGSMKFVKVKNNFFPALVLGKPRVSERGYIVFPVLVNGRTSSARGLFDNIPERSNKTP